MFRSRRWANVTIPHDFLRIFAPLANDLQLVHQDQETRRLAWSQEWNRTRRPNPTIRPRPQISIAATARSGFQRWPRPCPTRAMPGILPMPLLSLVLTTGGLRRWRPDRQASGLGASRADTNGRSGPRAQRQS